MKKNNSIPFEIEKKFLIKKPDISEFSNFNFTSISEIEQIYLKSENSFLGERIRKRVFEEKIEYTHTKKQKITNLKRIEIEKEITEEEYNTLYQKRDENLNVIHKKRYVFDYNGQVFEMDIFDFWDEVCFLEIELESEETEIDFPKYVNIISEVTEDRAFTNRSLAKKIPSPEKYLK